MAISDIDLEYDDALTSSATFSGQQVREIVIGGRARGLSLPGTALPGTMLLAVQTALRADNRGMGMKHPDDPSIRLLNVGMRPLSSDAVAFQLRYSSFIGATPSALIIDVDFAERSIRRSFYPGTRQPIYVGWQGRKLPGDSPTGTESDFFKPPRVSPRIESQVVSIPVQQTVVRLTGTRVFYGSPTTESVIKAGSSAMTVNNKPFLGRRKGSWKQTRYKSTTNRYGGTTSFALSAISYGGEDDYEDHRVCEVLRDQRTGRWAMIDQAKMKAAVEAPYEFGAIGQSFYNAQRDGFIVVGPYRLADFDKIWDGIIDLNVPPAGVLNEITIGVGLEPIQMTWPGVA